MGRATSVCGLNGTRYGTRHCGPCTDPVFLYLRADTRPCTYVVSLAYVYAHVIYSVPLICIIQSRPFWPRSKPPGVGPSTPFCVSISFSLSFTWAFLPPLSSFSFSCTFLLFLRCPLCPLLLAPPSPFPLRFLVLCPF